VQLIPTPKKDHRLPVILSPQEVLQLLQAAPSFAHHVIFSTMYGTGMRVSEAVHLRDANMDSQRMMIRIELSKGHKDRDVQLSPKVIGTAALLLAQSTAWRMDVPRRNSRSTAKPACSR
jgi:site-specific recombinase XerD